MCTSVYICVHCAQTICISNCTALRVMMYHLIRSKVKFACLFACLFAWFKFYGTSPTLQNNFAWWFEIHVYCHSASGLSQGKWMPEPPPCTMSVLNATLIQWIEVNLYFFVQVQLRQKYLPQARPDHSSTHDLQIMDTTFHVLETFTLTTEPSGDWIILVLRWSFHDTSWYTAGWEMYLAGRFRSLHSVCKTSTPVLREFYTTNQIQDSNIWVDAGVCSTEVEQVPHIGCSQVRVQPVLTLVRSWYKHCPFF